MASNYPASDRGDEVGGNFARCVRKNAWCAETRHLPIKDNASTAAHSCHAHQIARSVRMPEIHGD